MKIGYARVSTEDQNLDLQIKALKRVNCDRIFTDHGQSGFGFKRQGLEAAIADLGTGDTLIVWRLDRLGRSLSRLVQFMDELGRRGIEFQSLNENIDTATSGGRLMFHMMAALAEFERSLISERTRAGMAAARDRGRPIGRPRVLTQQMAIEAYCAIHCKNRSTKEVADIFQISRRTLRRRLQEISLAMEASRTCPICDGNSVTPSHEG